MWNRIKKIFLVVFLTLLIWVWADLSNDEVLSNKNVTIRLAKTINPQYWVMLDNGEYTNVKVNLKGPARKIADLRRETQPIEFSYDPVSEDLTSQEVPVPVLDIIRKVGDFNKRGVSVESSDPLTINVKIQRLVKDNLNIQCFDENNNILEPEVIEPASTVAMYIPASWTGNMKRAIIKLTDAEKQKARRDFIEVKPYIELQPGAFRRVSNETFRLKLVSTAQQLSPHQVAPVIGFVINQTHLGKFRIQDVDIQPKTIEFRATDSAFAAFEKQVPNKVLIEITQADIDQITSTGKPLEIKDRAVIYNFPAEYVRKNEIVIDKEPARASFKLVPINE